MNRTLYCIMEADGFLKGVYYNEIVAFRNYDYNAGDQILEIVVNFQVGKKIYYVIDPRVMLFQDINNRTLENGKFVCSYYSVKVDKSGPEESLMNEEIYPENNPELFS